MKYITGIYALNLPCSLETTGDWHQSALDWSNEKITYADTDNSIFGEWGIEKYKEDYVADTLRAVLDLMCDKSKDMTRYLKGFRHDFICTSKYDNIFFKKVFSLKNHPNWEKIDCLMNSEYKMKWINFKGGEHGL